MRTKHLRARLPEAEYASIKSDSDRNGLTISEHVRTVLAAHKLALSQEALMSKIEVVMGRHISSGAGAASQSTEILIFEVLILIRELVADRNPQILTRVSARLDHIYPQRKKV